MVSARVRAYHASTRWLVENGVIRETAPNYQRAVGGVVAKTGRQTKTQEKITLRRIGKEIDAMRPEVASSVEDTANKVQAHIVTHGEIVAPMAAKETIAGTARFYARVKEGWERALDVPATWGAPDEKAVEVITQWDKVFLGSHYQDTLTRRAEKIIVETVEEAGGAMSRREIGARLKTEMKGIVRPKEYWEIVAAQDISTARSWSSARFFKEAEIEKYEVSAIGDERTCPICLFMDGQILEVEKTLERLAQYEEAESVDDVKEVSGWLSAAQDDEGNVGIYAGDEELTGEMTGEDLQAMGVDAPAFHALCRCTVLAVF